MTLDWLLRWGAVSGVILGLSVGVPGLIEAFTGETAVTSAVIGLGAAFGAPALTALYLRQAEAAGRFGAIAYATNLIGLGLFAGVGFALNLVVFYLDEATVATLLAGPTRVALLASAVVFVVGTLLFTVSMVRAGAFPRISAIGYGLSLTLLALLAPLPDTVFTSLVHVAACLALVHLSISLWSAPAPVGDRPARVAVG
ncbi:hypothetical protein GCM10009682_37730 [Luedemannella flava]|uniref:Uncharacterized protein n=1 Tax=Luedemannella flava TaxID=349316 RepID=A0ABN2M7A0_9ACTN